MNRPSKLSLAGSRHAAARLHSQDQSALADVSNLAAGQQRPAPPSQPALPQTISDSEEEDEPAFDLAGAELAALFAAPSPAVPAVPAVQHNQQPAGTTAEHRTAQGVNDKSRQVDSPDTSDSEELIDLPRGATPAPAIITSTAEGPSGSRGDVFGIEANAVGFPAVRADPSKIAANPFARNKAAGGSRVVLTRAPITAPGAGVDASHMLHSVLGAPRPAPVNRQPQPLTARPLPLVEDSEEEDDFLPVRRQPERPWERQQPTQAPAHRPKHQQQHQQQQRQTSHVPAHMQGDAAEVIDLCGSQPMDEGVTAGHSSPCHAAQHANQYQQYHQPQQQQQQFEPQQQQQQQQQTNGSQQQQPGATMPWWHRLPHFVPIDALRNGRNPRDGSLVYIDYKAQFNGDATSARAADNGDGPGGASTSASGRGKKRAASSGTRAKKTPTARWWTDGRGMKCYSTADGRQLTGREAYAAAKEDRTGMGKKGRGGGGGAKRKVKRRRKKA